MDEFMLHIIILSADIQHANAAKTVSERAILMIAFAARSACHAKALRRRVSSPYLSIPPFPEVNEVGRAHRASRDFKPEAKMRIAVPNLDLDSAERTIPP